MQIAIFPSNLAQSHLTVQFKDRPIYEKRLGSVFTLSEDNNAWNNASDIGIENNFISKILASSSLLKTLVYCDFSAFDIAKIDSISSYWTADMDSTWKKQ